MMMDGNKPDRDERIRRAQKRFTDESGAADKVDGADDSSGFMTDHQRMVEGIRYHMKFPPDKRIGPERN